MTGEIHYQDRSEHAHMTRVLYTSEHAHMMRVLCTSEHAHMMREGSAVLIIYKFEISLNLKQENSLSVTSEELCSTNFHEIRNYFLNTVLWLNNSKQIHNMRFSSVHFQTGCS